ncbi:hypothetical protein FB45DRAFT_1040842 [Roridomyces roridus]|uniref:Uncharacterized protein n=1 Tax=Roridomyces roridus TaxID=1738132 RepID=A0AAD7B122_9AGAR|nr:hypothetical protein FB45DRAFT_1040842 [Roridomyces roridus]
MSTINTSALTNSTNKEPLNAPPPGGIPKPPATAKAGGGKAPKVSRHKRATDEATETELEELARLRLIVAQRVAQGHAAATTTSSSPIGDAATVAAQAMTATPITSLVLTGDNGVATAPPRHPKKKNSGNVERVPETPANSDQPTAQEQTPTPPTPKYSMIAQPKGKYTVQIEMRLAGMTKKEKFYNTIADTIRRLAQQADLPFDLTWKGQPLDKISIIYKAAAEKIPYLQRFENHWATKDLLQQYLKNRRAKMYAKGEATVPEQYEYLSTNSAMRSESGSRVKKAKVVRLEKESQIARKRAGGSAQGQPAWKKQNVGGDFVQGSSRDVEEPAVGNEDDARPTVDEDFEEDDEDDDEE